MISSILPTGKKRSPEKWHGTACALTAANDCLARRYPTATSSNSAATCGCRTRTALSNWKTRPTAGGLKPKSDLAARELQLARKLKDDLEAYARVCLVIRGKNKAARRKELAFDRLDGGDKIGTAGTKGAGRSATIQLFHGCEVGFWAHADSWARRHSCSFSGGLIRASDARLFQQRLTAGQSLLCANSKAASKPLSNASATLP
jgi:hypothetical protein